MANPNFTQLLSKIGADRVVETYRDLPDQLTAACEAWDLLEQGKSFEAGKLLHEYDKENKISSMDPLLGTIYVRVGLALMQQYPDNELLVSEGHGTVTGSSLAVWNAITLIEMAFVEKYGNLKHVEVTAIFFHLELILQFALFYAISFCNIELEEEDPCEVDWKRHRFDELYDYSGIDPVLLELCPPHYMWKRYLIDETVYELQDDGSVKEIPLSKHDIKRAPLGGLRMEREKKN